MKKIAHTITLIFLMAALAASSSSVLAQDDEPQPLDDKFVGALVAMAVNDNLMEGENEVRDLKALRSYVNEYYDGRLASYSQSSSDAQWLDLQRKLLVSKLDEKINLQFGRTMIQTMLTLFTDADMMAMTQVRQVVSGSEAPPADYFSIMNSAIMTNPQAMVDLLLDFDNITARPSIASSISASSSWSHDLSAISDSTAGIRVQGGSQPAVSFGGIDDAPSSSGGGLSVKKPVRFDNNGFDSVTVKVSSYTPASGASANIPSASTVVSPNASSSAYLELPLGTYTFCYEWQLDQDYDNDDYFDYHHRTSGSVTLTESASDDPNSAVTVTLSPDSAVSNPNGKCGQDAVESTGDLTPEEAVNSGAHIYLITCTGADWCEGESDIANADISFSTNQVSLIDRDANSETMVLNRVNQNQYRWTNAVGDIWTITFTMQGFIYQSNEGAATFLYTLQDDSNVPLTPSNVQPKDSDLSPQEIAMAGTHTYSVTYPEFSNEPEASVTYTITFSPGSAVIQDTYGSYYIFGLNEVYLKKIGEGLYSFSQSGDYQTGTVTFTDGGFTTVWTDSGLTGIHTLQE